MTNATICGNINKIGYLMSPGTDAYEDVSRAPDTRWPPCPSIASGAIPPEEALSYVKGLGIKSIVFGASTREHIAETIKLVRK